ncbi:MAG: hypothetical protein DWI58_02160 [Chloroflexi bacterium]|nr:MAG: hypothetical protein DWI58_02160 [Chloroflexota bacterium]
MLGCVRARYFGVPYRETQMKTLAPLLATGFAAVPVAQPTPVSTNPAVRMLARCPALFIQPSIINFERTGAVC